MIEYILSLPKDEQLQAKTHFREYIQLSRVQRKEIDSFTEYIRSKKINQECNGIEFNFHSNTMVKKADLTKSAFLTHPSHSFDSDRYRTSNLYSVTCLYVLPFPRIGDG